MPQLSGRDYPLSPTPEMQAVSQGQSFLGLGSPEKRAERRETRQANRAERQSNREVRKSFRSPRCGRRGCPGQGSGMGFGGY
jgi:hypothetical protein